MSWYISDLNRGDIDIYCLLKTNVRCHSERVSLDICRMNRQAWKNKEKTKEKQGKTQITFNSARSGKACQAYCAISKSR